MIQLLYFARLREVLGLESEPFPWQSPASVAELKASLAGRGGVWQTQFVENASLRTAINQELVSETALVQPGDEVAFFPPVTGG